MIDLSKLEGHAPAPWSRFETESGNGRFTVERLGSNQFVPSRKIAIVNADKGHGAANAALIAAAPELLAEVKNLRAEVSRLKAQLAAFTALECQ